MAIGDDEGRTTTATVLFQHGVTNINTVADAAQALEPLVHPFPHSGQVAKDIFAVDVIDLGFLGIPVLAGSAAYALSEAMNWKEGFAHKFGDARGFYGVIIISTLVGFEMSETKMVPAPSTAMLKPSLFAQRSRIASSRPEGTAVPPNRPSSTYGME